MRNFYCYLTLFIIFTNLNRSYGDWDDYMNRIGNFFNFRQINNNNDNTHLIGDDYTPRIPYEVSIKDEEFISEAQKLTGVALSELDSCQQRVVLKLQTDCDKMNDVQVAKMAVHLLNCQSYVEGRAIYPCTDDMSIKDCTINMDSDTWTSYHLMSNRARAVCYSIRQVQFRGLAEHTVNRLMNAATDQLKTLRNIADNQENLQDMTEFTLNTLTKGQDSLAQQQKEMQQAQFHNQLTLEDNINKLIKEKELILETHNRLVEMTRNVQKKLEDSAKELDKQVGENRDNHQELLDDIIAIQNKAQIIFERIDESSQLLLLQNENFKKQYDSTLKNLAEVNRTVHNLVRLVGGTKQALEERLEWLTHALGGTDLAVERLSLILWHCAFMLISMLSCAFLSARFSTRVIVTIIPPLNLAVALMDNQKQLGPLGLTLSILSFVLIQMIFLIIQNYRVEVPTKINSGSLQWEQPSSSNENNVETNKPIDNTNDYQSDYTIYKHNSDKSSTNELDDEFKDAALPTPPLSRSGFYSPRSRSRTPLHLNGSFRGSCQAKTRAGTPCKITSQPGRDYCYRHQLGDSVIG